MRGFSRPQGPLRGPVACAPAALPFVSVAPLLRCSVVSRYLCHLCGLGAADPGALHWGDALGRKSAPAQRRHHCARRSRQDHAGGCPAAPERRVPRQRARGRTGDGQQRARARARHHDPREEHRGPLPGRPDQHRRHARPRGLRRRGRADAVDGRRRDAAGRCVRGAAAADAVRAAQGSRAPADADRRDQQDRPSRRARRRKC